MKRRIKIDFADLLHTGHGCNAVPYGLACVASYARRELSNEIEVRLFKYPDALAAAWEADPPDIACFSGYVWNANLAYAFAERFKARYPKRVTVCGGPHVPLERNVRAAFLSARPAIDFYITRQGERPFVSLLQALLDCDLDLERFKQEGCITGSCSYRSESELIEGPLLPPLSSLDEIPSPYLSGLCDEFLADPRLTPLVETVRGCPFSCAYCEQGHDYFNRLARAALPRVEAELEYIAKRARSPLLMIADSNFGMYKDDVAVSRCIARVRAGFGWPRKFVGIGGKNRKERVLEVTAITGAPWVSAAVQSTDRQVLRNVRRENVSLEQMVQVAQEGEALGCTSFSEVILALPGDTRAAHFKSMADLVDAGMKVVRSHQFIMLPGSEMATGEMRSKFGFTTRYRVVPTTAAAYTLWNFEFSAPEIDEIVIGHHDLSFDDYLQCRLLDLTVEIFHNDDPFREIRGFLALRGVKASDFILALFENLRSAKGPLADLREGFWRETSELWESESEVREHLARTTVMDQYRSGRLGNNEQLLYRAVALFSRMDALHDLLFQTAAALLRRTGKARPADAGYLRELVEFSRLARRDVLGDERSITGTFHFDFAALGLAGFPAEPEAFACPDGLEIELAHSGEQARQIESLRERPCTEPGALLRMLNAAAPLSALFRLPRTRDAI